MEKKDLKIIFFGTPEFAVESLRALVEGGYNVCAVVTMPNKTGGRGHKLIESDVKLYAQSAGLPVLQPEKLKDPAFLSELRDFNADLFIVIAFRMLPEVVWGMPRLGTFNLHGSLLPKYRGAAPINRAIMNGETETGVTTFFLKHEIDTGDIIGRKKIEITDQDNAGTVHDKLMRLGSEMVIETVEAILDGTLQSIPQPEGEFIGAPKIFKEDCRIDWKKDARAVHNHIRGLAPYPAAWTTMVEKNGRRMDVKIYSSVVSDEECGDTEPGKVIEQRSVLSIGTGRGAVRILEIQPVGKKRMDAATFLLGYHPDIFIDTGKEG